MSLRQEGLIPDAKQLVRSQLCLVHPEEQGESFVHCKMKAKKSEQRNFNNGSDTLFTAAWQPKKAL